MASLVSFSHYWKGFLKISPLEGYLRTWIIQCFSSFPFSNANHQRQKKLFRPLNKTSFRTGTERGSGSAYSHLSFMEFLSPCEKVTSCAVQDAIACLEPSTLNPKS